MKIGVRCADPDPDLTLPGLLFLSSAAFLRGFLGDRFLTLLANGLNVPSGQLSNFALTQVKRFSLSANVLAKHEWQANRQHPVRFATVRRSVPIQHGLLTTFRRRVTKPEKRNQFRDLLHDRYVAADLYIFSRQSTRDRLQWLL